MNLTNINPDDLYPTEKVGPSVKGTLLYKVGEHTHFEGAYITTNERLIMNVDMNGEPYARVFSYLDIEDILIEKEAIVISFPGGMGKIAMVDVTEGNKQEFVSYVKDQLKD